MCKRRRKRREITDEFDPNVQEGDYIEGEKYTFEPYAHNLKYGVAAKEDGQIKAPEGYIISDIECIGTSIGYSYRIIFTNTVTVEATAVKKKGVAGCHTPGKPIEKEEVK